MFTFLTHVIVKLLWYTFKQYTQFVHK